MRTATPIEDIDFDETNIKKVRIATRLPMEFIIAIGVACLEGKALAEYLTKGGNRYVARITRKEEVEYVDYILNPED